MPVNCTTGVAWVASSRFALLAIDKGEGMRSSRRNTAPPLPIEAEGRRSRRSRLRSQVAGRRSNRSPKSIDVVDVDRCRAVVAADVDLRPSTSATSADLYDIDFCRLLSTSIDLRALRSPPRPPCSSFPLPPLLPPLVPSASRLRVAPLSRCGATRCAPHRGIVLRRGPAACYVPTPRPGRATRPARGDAQPPDGRAERSFDTREQLQYSQRRPRHAGGGAVTQSFGTRETKVQAELVWKGAPEGRGAAGRPAAFH